MKDVAPDLRFPAEFEKHEATWLMWPVRPDNWRDKAFFGQMEMLTFISLLSHYETINLGVSPDTNFPYILPNVNTVEVAYDDVWVRDTGPTVLSDGNGLRLAVDWEFNSWGGLYESAELDDSVAGQLAHHHGFNCIHAPIVLEGGAILSDGKGTLFVTDESVINENRNPGLSKGEAEKVLAHFANCKNVIWIPEGLANDEAGGHVDNLLTFSSSRSIVLSSTNDPSNPSYQRLKEVRKVIDAARNCEGQGYEIIEVPLPEETSITESEARGFGSAEGSISRAPGTHLAPSYSNVCISNSSVLVPVFGSANDKVAVDVYRKAFPDRYVIPVRSREFLMGGGGLHCLSREIPI